MYAIESPSRTRKKSSFGMVGQCLDRRIPDLETLISEVAHWERQRNDDKARIKWLFNVERARRDLGRAYPTPITQPSVRAAA